MPRKIVRLAALALLWGRSALTASFPEGTFVQVTNEHPVYPAPNATASPLDTLSVGMLVDVLEADESGEWLRIRSPASEGWIPSRQTSFSPRLGELIRATLRSEPGANVRAEPSVDAEVLTVAPYGMSFTLLGIVETPDDKDIPRWLGVLGRDGSVGYIAAHLTDFAAKPPPVPAPAPVPTPDPGTLGGWMPLHSGVQMGSVSIPQELGRVTSFQGFSFVSGKVSHFGGPADRGITETETGALTGELLRKINPNDYYCAMRWDYQTMHANVGTAKKLWSQKRILIVNPANGRAVVARPNDWGPHVRTERIIDVSPGALKAIGATTDNLVLVSFAQDDAPLGQVNADVVRWRDDDEQAVGE